MFTNFPNKCVTPNFVDGRAKKYANTNESKYGCLSKNTEHFCAKKKVFTDLGDSEKLLTSQDIITNKRTSKNEKFTKHQ